MRHVFAAQAIAAGPFGVGKPPQPTALVTAASRLQRMAPCRLRTAITAIDLAPVAVAA